MKMLNIHDPGIVVMEKLKAGGFPVVKKESNIGPYYFCMIDLNGLELNLYQTIKEGHI